MHRSLFLSILLIFSFQLFGFNADSAEQSSKKRAREINLLDLDSKEPGFIHLIYPNNGALNNHASQVYENLKEQVKLMHEEDIIDIANRFMKEKKFKHIAILFSVIPTKIGIKCIDKISLDFLENFVDENGLSLPKALCLKGCGDILKFLLEKYPSLVNNNWRNNINLLHTAIFSNNKETVNLLLNINPDIINSTLSSGESILHVACLNNDSDIIKLLVEINPDLLERTDNKIALPLHYAIRKNNIGIVKYFLEKKPSLIKAVDNKNSNCLDFAVIFSSLEMVKLIFEKDSTLVNKGDHKNNPFILSLLKEQYDVADFFLSKDPNLINWTNRNGFNLLFHAIIEKNIKQISFLIDHDISDISIVNSTVNGNSALYQAVIGNSLEIVKIIYEKNPGMVKHINRCMLNPLEVAIINDQRDILKFFISKNSSLLATKGWLNNNLLHVLCQRNKIKNINWLISKMPQLAYEPNNISLLPLQYLDTPNKLIIADKILFDKYVTKTDKYKNLTINETILNRNNVYNPRIALLLLQYKLDLQDLNNNNLNNNLNNNYLNNNYYEISKQLRKLIKTTKLVYATRHPLFNLAKTNFELIEQFKKVKELTDNLLIIFLDSSRQKGLRSIQIGLQKQNKNNSIISDKFLSVFYSPRQIMGYIFSNFYNKNIIELIKTISKEFNLTKILDMNKNNLLHHAAFHPNIEVAIILVYLNPALIDMKNKNKETPLTINLLGARLLSRQNFISNSKISHK